MRRSHRGINDPLGVLNTKKNAPLVTSTIKVKKDNFSRNFAIIVVALIIGCLYLIADPSSIINLLKK